MRPKNIIRRASDFALRIARRKPEALRIAHEKRALERQLRAEGKSRKESAEIVSQRFHNRGEAT